MINFSKSNERTVIEAAKALKHIRPAYEQVIDYYQQIFVEQEKAKQHIQITPIDIPENHLSVKIREGFPLVNLSDFIIDTKATRELVRKICTITETSGLSTSNAAVKLKKALEEGNLEINALSDGILRQETALFHSIEIEFDIAADFLNFSLYQGMIPSIQICSEQLSGHIQGNEYSNTGVCPICGSTPDFSMFNDEGERHVFCGFCRHPWRVERIFCPFCENEDRETLNYLYTEEEKEYRVDLCDQCKKYMKCIDVRDIDRPAYPPLEHAATMHLDIKAQEAGYLAE